MNWFSHILYIMLPVSLLSLATVVVAIVYKWKRGLEVFMFLCGVLIVRNLSASNPVQALNLCRTILTARMPLESGESDESEETQERERDQCLVRPAHYLDEPGTTQKILTCRDDPEPDRQR